MTIEEFKEFNENKRRQILEEILSSNQYTESERKAYVYADLIASGKADAMYRKLTDEERIALLSTTLSTSDRELVQQGYVDIRKLNEEQLKILGLTIDKSETKNPEELEAEKKKLAETNGEKLGEAFADTVKTTDIFDSDTNPARTAKSIMETNVKGKVAKDYNSEKMPKFPDYVEIVDYETGENISAQVMQDAIRMSRVTANGEIPDDVAGGNVVMHNERIPKNLLKQFLTKKDTNDLHPRSAIDNLGLYITDTFVSRMVSLDGANDKLDAIENTDITQITNFVGYNKLDDEGSFKSIDKKEEDVSVKVKGQEQIVKRTRPHLGIGLGEAMVMNPTFQYNVRTDPRTNPLSTKLGRIYSTKFMNGWTTVLFRPGRLKYNTGFFKMLGLGMGSGATEMLIRTGGDGILGALASFVTSVGDALSVVGTVASAIFGGSKLVEFKQSINLYKEYVRFLYLTLAGMMGLLDGRGNYVGKSNILDLTHVLPTANLSGGADYLQDQFIAFRVGKGVSSGESFSNSMTSNPLMEQMNSQAQQSDEANGGTTSDAMSGDVTKVITNVMKKAALKVASQFSESALVLSGKGRASLPDVFASSSFSRNFSFAFKFHSPYGDNMSIFENLYIPFLTLLAFSAPRQIGKMSYTSPFALQVNVKNHVFIPTAMVESLSVTRGQDSNDWTPSGYPKTLTVELTIKDCEPNIALPLASRGPIRSAMEIMFPATGISEYLMSLGGLTLRDMNLFSGSRIDRAKQMFFATWNSKLDWDNISSTILNTSWLQNISNLFLTTDKDAVNQGYGDNLKISETMANQSRGAWSLIGKYNSLVINGSNAKKEFSTDYGTASMEKAQVKEDASAVIKELNS